MKYLRSGYYEHVNFNITIVNICLLFTRCISTGVYIILLLRCARSIN